MVVVIIIRIRVLAVNHTTAKAIGIELPMSILLRGAAPIE
jgi:hypothetical protein